MHNARIKAHTGICVGQTSMLMMPKTNIVTNIQAYHHSGTTDWVKTDNNKGNKQTLWVVGHKSGMNIWLLMHCETRLNPNLLSEV